MSAFSAGDYFNLEETDHRVVFENTENVWEVLPKIASYLGFRLKPAILGKLIGKPFVSTMVYVGKGTVIEQGAMIKGPAWIGENCEIRSGCYIRENVIVGDGCVLGNSCEFKNSLLFNRVQVPHFNYVGDSILGSHAHLGAGVILSNVRLDNRQVVIQTEEGALPTGLRKFGAIIGDHAEIGCNSVLNPGSLIGPRSLVYPLTSWQGVLPADSVAKSRVPLSIMARPVKRGDS